MKTVPNPFPMEIRTLAHISRWAINWFHRHDSVAEHSFFSCVYAYLIAGVIGWKGNHGNMMFRVLTHDMPEVVTGDIISPAKKAIVNSDRHAEFVGHHLERKMPTLYSMMYDLERHHEYSEYEAICVAADRLEALFKLIEEKKMGNTMVDTRIIKQETLVHAAWLELPARKEWLHDTWHKIMVPSIAEAKAVGSGGEGI